jgi:hypothetical protein
LTRVRFGREADPEERKTLSFSRLQFPIKPAFAMTIHKVQGQTLSNIGISLNTEIFSHGMLYVALSRVREVSGISIFNPSGNRVVVNVVCPAVRQFVEENDSNHREVREVPLDDMEVDA